MEENTDKIFSMCQKLCAFYRFGCDCILTFLRAESIKLWQHLGQSGRKNIMFQQGLKSKYLKLGKLGEDPG